MSNPNAIPPKGHQFQKGNPGGPGKPKQLLTKDKVSHYLGKFAMMTRAELEAVKASTKSSMIEITIAAIFIRAADDGDYSRLEFLLARSIGKVKDIAEVHQTIEGNLEKLDKHPEKNVLKLLREMHGPKIG